MAVITIGPWAIVRAYTTADLTTYLDLAVPANGTGTMTSFELYCSVQMTTVTMGTFYGSGTSWTSRDSEYLGTVGAGEKQTFSGLNCDVTINDVVGVYFTGVEVKELVTG